ncbi:MAG: hypothetical protein ACI814_004733 [Mariniblastus sp.]|jgi:uncharacterized protein YceH (UPF0502 family)
MDPSSSEESSEESSDSTAESLGEPRTWGPLTQFQRRVAGVLVEKSKTTPDIYPMTLNGLKTGSNQKSNRSPQLDLREDQVEEALYELREMGAVIEVYSGGRVPKFKHQLYDWLNVSQVELAVMTELLLRGEQTLGDLRGRAARMDKIAGVAELKPIVVSLIEKGLIVELTAPGRGQVVTHGLYLPAELTRLKAQFGGYVSSGVPRRADSFEPANREQTADNRPELESLRTELAELKEAVAEMKRELDEIRELLK